MNQDIIKNIPQTGIPDSETSAIKKMRLRLIPYLLLLYAIAYLDRTNISYAALEMNKELGINPAQFGMLASIFFIRYFLFEVPSNIALHKFGARKWIARILVTWGIVAVGTAFVTHVSHIYLLHCAFCSAPPKRDSSPASHFILPTGFPANTVRGPWRFFLAQILCTCLGAPLSGWIMDNVSALGMAGWRWMILLEGFLAIVLGFATLIVLRDGPQNVK